MLTNPDPDKSIISIRHPNMLLLHTHFAEYKQYFCVYEIYFYKTDGGLCLIKETKYQRTHCVSPVTVLWWPVMILAAVGASDRRYCPESRSFQPTKSFSLSYILCQRHFSLFAVYHMLKYTHTHYLWTFGQWLWAFCGGVIFHESLGPPITVHHHLDQLC